MKTPITFEQFSKDPVKGLLFIVIVAIGYLYIDIKMNYSGQVDKCDTESAQYRREITKETVSNQKINKIALTTWGILFILFVF